MAILLIGTLDTKGVELGFVRSIFHELGRTTLLVDGLARPADDRAGHPPR